MYLILLTTYGIEARCDALGRGLTREGKGARIQYKKVQNEANKCFTVNKNIREVPHL
jgi:hypothetical protein